MMALFVEDVMKKLCLLALLMATHAQAFQATKEDMVGVWQCYTDAYDIADDATIKSVTLDRLNQDGTMSQVWEVVSYAGKEVESIEHLTIKNRWDFKDDKLSIYDWKLIDYQVYDGYKLPFDETVVKKAKQYWQSEYNEPYSETLKFINEREFVFENEDKETINVRSGCTKKDS